MQNKLYEKQSSSEKSSEHSAPWEQQDHVQSAIDLVKSGSIERQEAEEKDDDYYIVIIKPDLKTLVEQVLMQNQAKNAITDILN